MFVTIHIFGVVRPDNQYHANSTGSYASRHDWKSLFFQQVDRIETSSIQPVTAYS